MMDKREARSIADDVLDSLRTLSYTELLATYRDAHHHRTVTGVSGVEYQVEVDARWDGRPDGDLRVFVWVDDGGISAFSPVGTDFVMAPDGSFVGE